MSSALAGVTESPLNPVQPSAAYGGWGGVADAIHDQFDNSVVPPLAHFEMFGLDDDFSDLLDE